MWWAAFSDITPTYQLFTLRCAKWRRSHHYHQNRSLWKYVESRYILICIRILYQTVRKCYVYKRNYERRTTGDNRYEIHLKLGSRTGPESRAGILVFHLNPWWRLESATMPSWHNAYNTSADVLAITVLQACRDYLTTDDISDTAISAVTHCADR